jgi:putative endonuclease
MWYTILKQIPTEITGGGFTRQTFMQYVYILRSLRDGNLYIGCTNDIRRRFKEHNGGKIDSTMERVPFELLFYESFINKKEAFARERWFKTGFGRNHIKKMLFKTLKV